MQLYLCEKPSQGRDVAKGLGATEKGEGCLKGHGVVVTWAFGHLLEQAPPEAYDPAYKRWALETLPIIPGEWKSEVKKETKKQFTVIRKLLSQASEVVVATDADREGESIAREILEQCGYRGSVKRLWLSALDDESVRKALGNLLPGEQTYPLYLSAMCRSRADWLVGMNLTRAYTVLAREQGYDGVLSVGRVQTPTLRLVVDRDRDIERFVPKPFWEVLGQFSASTGSFAAKWKPADEKLLDEEGRCINQQAAQAVAVKVAGGTGSITQLETRRKKEAPPLAFDLSTLQQEASRRWGYGAQDVLNAAQALYEKHKATSYPRTDCGYLPESQLSEAKQVVAAVMQSDSTLQPLQGHLDMSRKSRVWNDAKITAHHGIIPTLQPCKIDSMSEMERNLYDAIRRRYLAQFLPDHEYDHTTVTVNVGNEQFGTTGRKIVVPGWKALVASGNDQDKKDEQTLPPLTLGESCHVVGVEVQNKQTAAPKSFTEGTLIAAMTNASRFVTDLQLKQLLREHEGIGTEATRAGVIETLLKRGYLERKKRAIVSTATARTLIDALPPMITDVGTTALWEQSLGDVQSGKLSLDTFMNRQEAVIRKLVQLAGNATMRLPVQPSKTCPECGSNMRKRNSERGAFWGCIRYPDCKGIINVGGKSRARSKRAAS